LWKTLKIIDYYQYIIKDISEEGEEEEEEVELQKENNNYKRRKTIKKEI